jgi:hypothetical protein
MAWLTTSGANLPLGSTCRPNTSPSSGVADVPGAMKDGRVDFTVSNATPARANDVAFSPIVLSVELGYLVPANSPISRTDELDRPGVRISVTKGSTSERTLPARFTNAKIVAAENVKLAVEMFSRGEIDSYATNKPTLFEMSDAMPGARVLDGNWRLEHIAIAIPKGHKQGLTFVADFVQEVQGNGRLEQIQKDAGLRGVVKAERWVSAISHSPAHANARDPRASAARSRRRRTRRNRREGGNRQTGFCHGISSRAFLSRQA